jgi:hypothetical protein
VPSIFRLCQSKVNIGPIIDDRTWLLLIPRESAREAGIARLRRPGPGGHVRWIIARCRLPAAEELPEPHLDGLLARGLGARLQPSLQARHAQFVDGRRDLDRYVEPRRRPDGRHCKATPFELGYRERGRLIERGCGHRDSMRDAGAVFEGNPAGAWHDSSVGEETTKIKCRPARLLPSAHIVLLVDSEASWTKRISKSISGIWLTATTILPSMTGLLMPSPRKPRLARSNVPVHQSRPFARNARSDRPRANLTGVAEGA